MKQKFQLSSEQVSQLYNQMVPKRGEITKAASTGGFLSPIEGFKTERAVRKHRGEYVREPDKYINEHHRLCALKQDYPPVPQSDDKFSQSDWVDWLLRPGAAIPNNKTLNLPKEQTHLQLMGITP